MRVIHQGFRVFSFLLLLFLLNSCFKSNCFNSNELKGLILLASSLEKVDSDDFPVLIDHNLVKADGKEYVNEDKVHEQGGKFQYLRNGSDRDGKGVILLNNITLRGEKFVGISISFQDSETLEDQVKVLNKLGYFSSLGFLVSSSTIKKSGQHYNYFKMTDQYPNYEDLDIHMGEDYRWSFAAYKMDHDLNGKLATDNILTILVNNENDFSEQVEGIFTGRDIGQ